MSKGNMLLGHARGKVGDLVFSRTNGQQVVRSRAAVVKNPQTESQMIQRIILNTIAQAYSRLRPICDHSFEGVQQGQQSMSAFMRKNLKQIRAKVSQAVADNWDLYSIYAFTPVGQNAFMPNDFVLSSGSLPNVGAVTFPISTKAAVALGGDTYGDIIGANNLQRGDQLTFLVIKGTSAAAANLHYVRVILDPTNEDGSQAPLSSPFLANGTINLPSPRNTGTFAEVSLADNVLTFNVGATGQITQCAAVIVSRKGTDGNWMRSNTSFTLNTSGVAGFLCSLGEALDIFNAGGFDTENELYLNNAGTGPLAVSTNSNAGAFTFKTFDGSSVNIVGIEGNNIGGMAAVQAVTANGTKYFVRNNLSASGSYQAYMSTLTPTWNYNQENAFTDATGANAANTIGIDDGEDGGAAAIAWLKAHGVGDFS